MLGGSPDGIVYSGLLEEVIGSTRGDEIVNDFVEWGLLDIQVDDEGEQVFVAPDIWGTFIDTLDEANPDIGLESLGKLLGICSLVKNRNRRQHRPIGLKLYIPVKAVAVRARDQDGTINQAEAREEFTRNASWDADRRWLHLVYGDKQKVGSLRFFSDMTSDPWVLNPDVSVALERVIGRTNELLRERGITI